MFIVPPTMKGQITNEGECSIFQYAMPQHLPNHRNQGEGKMSNDMFD